MNDRLDRRGFLQSAGLAGAGALAAGGMSLATAAKPEPPCYPNAEKLGWQLCCTLYTFRRFSFYEALPKIASLGFRSVELCFFLKLCKKRPELKTNESLSAELRKELKTRLADHGLEMASFYSSLDGDEEAGREKFDFAAEMGVKTLVAEPPAEAFDLVEKLCDEYKINLAVHNHPKSPKSKYWKPENVLAVCQGRGKRIGACCDSGHWVRSDLKPIECLEKMEGRIISFHLKDVLEWGNPKARDVPLGTGSADYAAVLGELHRQGFQGVMAVEYEHDSEKLMDEVKESLAFVETTAASLVARAS